ncbi:Transcriptional regulator, LuxR family [Frankia canadensis]|uniref:Transcriptional regulator, LuxR family n=1 Tax=Frankia canadensis TaxID=1836972 RepID=A0A2I2KPP6_9ACTN|nr:LuxR family transcriptional regulator [Frankia canadensis]SNQ47637.1 Transcriptional regulator, LuxR family [Frankia canadensis]SOU54927.1 Transcriptional regulator, LuxR family [Frankia canadensis]
MGGAPDPRPEFAERLRALRDAAGLSIRDLVAASAKTPRRRPGEPPLRLKRSTVDGMISRSRPVRPTQDHLEVFVDTCIRVAQESGRPLPDDLGDRQRWDDAYRDLLIRMAGLRSVNRSATEAARRLARIEPQAADPGPASVSDLRPGRPGPGSGLAAGAIPDALLVDGGPASFVGRPEALRQLRRAVADVHGGRPRVALLEGPAGIGKTALVRHLLGEADAGAVLWASGEEEETGLSFGVLDQLTAEAARVLRADQPSPSGPGELTGPAGSIRGPSPDPLVAGAALVELLGELQRSGPVVLVVDDAHWADRPSLQALTFALRRLRADRVLALMMVRDLVDARLPDGLRRLLMDERTVRLLLEGLDDTELRALSSAHVTGPLSWRACARLRAHTGGNPLHARALLEEVPAEAFDNLDVPLPVPRSFAMLVVARLAAAPAGGRELATAASVLGAHPTLAQAAAVGGVDEPLPALEQAIAAGLLMERPVAWGLRFPHPLVHAAIYEQAGPARRAELHIRAAALAEEVALRLHHLARAATGPDGGLALELARLGREQATAGAWAAAANQLSAAARLAPSRTDYEQLTLEAADCQLLAGDVPDPLGKVGEVRGFRPTAWRDYLLGRFAFQRGDADEAETRLRSAWKRCDPDGGADADPLLAARVAGWLAALCQTKLLGAESAEWAGRALALSPGNAAFDLIGQIRMGGLAMSGHLDAVLESAADLPDPAVASMADLDMLAGRGSLHALVDDFAGARRDLGGVLAAGRGRSLLFRVSVTTTLAQAEYRAGLWDDAAIHCDHALSLMADSDDGALLPYCHQVGVLVPAARGHWVQAEEHVRTTQAFAESGFPYLVASAAIATAHLARARGLPAEIVAALEPPVRSGLLDLDAEPGTSGWQDTLVDALVEVGDLGRAEEVLIRFEAAARQRGRRATMAAAARSRGNLEARRDNTSAADRAFRAGLAEWEHVDLPFEQALLHHFYGAFLRRAGRPADAVRQLGAAHGTFSLLGARPYLDRCENELVAGGWTPRQGRSREPDASRLTTPELAVAKLVAAGLTNRQVARELVLSEKTVEHRLRAVFGKLDVTARTQLSGLMRHDTVRT